MTTHAAYCVPCDIQVEVRLDDGDRQITADNVVCPALEDACPVGGCPLARVSPAQLLDHLEFVPDPRGRRTGRGFRKAVRLVELARRRSMAREAGRVRRWWAENFPV